MRDVRRVREVLRLEREARMLLIDRAAFADHSGFPEVVGGVELNAGLVGPDLQSSARLRIDGTRCTMQRLAFEIEAEIVIVARFRQLRGIVDPCADGA